MNVNDTEPKIVFHSQPQANHVIQAQSKAYDFLPQPDITPLEAAWIAHFFAMFTTGHLARPEDYPEWNQIKKHFKEAL